MVGVAGTGRHDLETRHVLSPPQISRHHSAIFEVG
jgi:hypothetical protein